MAPGHLTLHRGFWRGEGGGEQSLETPRVWGGGRGLSASACHRQLGPAGEQCTSGPQAAPRPQLWGQKHLLPRASHAALRAPSSQTQPHPASANRPDQPRSSQEAQRGAPAGQGLPTVGAGQAGGPDSLSSGQVPSPRGRKCILATKPSWTLERTGHLSRPPQRQGIQGAKVAGCAGTRCQLPGPGQWAD